MDFPHWTMEKDLAHSDAVGVKTAILSLTAPGATILSTDEKNADYAHRINDQFAGFRDKFPQRYGFFGNLPSLSLETIDTCLKEINYMFDELKADGITLYTRYGSDNHYLGHPDFAPIWRELSRRKAVVFIHPGYPVDTNLVSAIPPFTLDFPQETTRAALDLIVNDTLRSYPDCKIILSHAGGTLPYLISRAAGLLPFTVVTSKSTEEILEEGRLFYFDTALSGNEVSLKALLSHAKPGHVLFGTDMATAPVPAIESYTGALEVHDMDDEMREQIDNKAALELFPRLKPFFERAGASKAKV